MNTFDPTPYILGASIVLSAIICGFFLFCAFVILRSKISWKTNSTRENGENPEDEVENDADYYPVVDQALADERQNKKTSKLTRPGILTLAFLLSVLASCSTTSPAPPVVPLKPCTGQHAPVPAVKNSCVQYMADPPPLGVLYAWAIDSTKWDRAELRVRFLNGSESLQNRTWRYFEEWNTICPGVKFKHVCSGESEIRVSFNGQGHWSYVGKENLTIPSHLPTMNLQFTALESEDEIARVTRHEAGHALGLQHEHQSPNAGIPWNVPATLSYYMNTQGWTEQQVRQQVINKSRESHYRATAFDSTSIMQYPVPAELTTNGFFVGWNKNISETDKDFIRKWYPAAAVLLP